MNATIISGTDTSRVIDVQFTSNAAAATGDSVKLIYTSACGDSKATAVKLTNTVTTAPVAPVITAAIITAITTNVCDGKVYRFTAPTLPAASLATTTVASATGRKWSFVGSLGQAATIISGTDTSRVIDVRFSSNAAAATGDSVKLLYTSACGNSASAAVKLINTVTTVPVAPVITATAITAITTNVCDGKVYRFTAPDLPAASGATTTVASVTGRKWSFVGSLGQAATIITGTDTSKVIDVRFSSNAAAATGDSVKLLYKSACGNSASAAVKLTNTVTTAPAAPAAGSIVPNATPITDVCGNRVYRFTAPVLPAAASATGSVASVTSRKWSFVGTLGSTATIIVGSDTSRVIDVKFTSNAGAATGDSIKLVYRSSTCGNSNALALKLPNVVKTGCLSLVRLAAPASTPKEEATLNVKVSPNPTTSNFNMQVVTAGKEPISVRILDVQGRFIRSINIEPNATINIGSELKAGAYFIEVKQGKSVKTTRVLKF